jgi:hypothetical protein
MTDYIHMRARKDGQCEVHDWPTDGMAIRLVRAMRATHPKGINVCADCVHRAKADADAKRGIA